MMKRILAVAGLITVLGPAMATAQERPALEIGMKAGLSVQRAEFAGETETLKMFNVPTGFMYLAFFPSDNVLIEPELSLDWASDGDDSATILGLVGWISFAPRGVTTNGLYFGAAPSLRYARFAGEGESEWGAAGRIGYRIIVRDAMAVRFEAGYTRWFDEETNVFTAQIGIGALLDRAT